MKRTLFFFLIMLLPITAAAQFTQVSATVTDPNGLAYANGTVVAKLVLPGGTSPTLNGLPYTPPSQPVGLSSVGFFLMQLADNNVLLPAATQWSFTVCSAAGTIQPAGGKGPVCFNAGPITITGASQSITATLNAAALALSSISGGGVSVGTNTLQKSNGSGGFLSSSITDNGTINVSSEALQLPIGSAAAPAVGVAGATGIFWLSGTGTAFTVSGTETAELDSANFFSKVPYCNFAGGTCLTEAVGLISITGSDHANFGFAVDKGQHLVSQAAQADSWGVATCAANTVTVTFTRAYTSTPAILVSDETTAGGARVSAKSNTAFTITCTGATDVVDYFSGGNPN